MKIAITGVSGFVGSQLAVKWLQRFNHEVIGVFHSNSAHEAERKAAKLKEHWQKHCNFLADVRFKPISWVDFVKGDFPHADAVELVFHAAASTDFDLPIEAARRANVEATLEALEAARKMRRLRRFIHVSTAFVGATERGLVNESTVPREFNNTYEQSKFESELAVQISGLPFTIARPSIIVGDSVTGYAKHFRVFYSMFRLWLTGVVPRAPLDLEAKADVVPIDFVTGSLSRIAEDQRALNQTVHICAGHRSPTVSEIFMTGIVTFDQKPPRFSTPLMLRILSHPIFARFIRGSLLEVLRVLRGHFPYLGSRLRVFSTKQLASLYGDQGLSPGFDDYGKTIFAYCLATRWGKTVPKLSER